jgi:hypothetical protein
MANHKRKGAKSTRSGCLLCKPHKRQGCYVPTRQTRRANVSLKEQLAEAYRSEK